MWIGAWIGEECLVDLLIRVFVLVRYVEILCLALAMVSAYKVLDGLGQMMFVGKFQSVGHMTDDNLCTLLVGQAGVGVGVSLVLRKEDGVFEFAYIVIHGTRTYQQAAGSNLSCRSCGEV